MIPPVDRPAEFSSQDEFWMDDIRRMTSPEADYGVHWRAEGRPWPQWRVSYMQDTGEVYAIENGHSSGMVRLLGVVTPDPVTSERDVYYRTLNGILHGWEDPAVSRFDLGWVMVRLENAR